MVRVDAGCRLPYCSKAKKDGIAPLPLAEIRQNASQRSDVDLRCRSRQKAVLEDEVDLARRPERRRGGLKKGF
jgi:hypothetical protein